MQKQVDGIGTKPQGTSNTLAMQKEKQKEQTSQANPQTAYMGPNIGNILNGSTPQPTASAFQA